MELLTAAVFVLDKLEKAVYRTRPRAPSNDLKIRVSQSKDFISNHDGSSSKAAAAH